MARRVKLPRDHDDVTFNYTTSMYSVRLEPNPQDRNQGKQVFYQGSRQMTNLSRRYYERELGAGLGPSPSMKEHFGYSEPFRRFIQRESFEPQANEIPNTMPSWLPGDDYMTNFKVGDPYVRIDDGYARLPGAGYEALHPELQGVDPEDYPDIHKLRILSDVAPYSREYNMFRQRLSSQASNDTGLQIELDKIVDRVRQVKESSIVMDRRRFTAPVDEIEGTVAKASPEGITLKEYPGRVFRLSSVGTSAADLSARVLGENHNQVSSSCRPTKPRAPARQPAAPRLPVSHAWKIRTGWLLSSPALLLSRPVASFRRWPFPIWYCPSQAPGFWLR